MKKIVLVLWICLFGVINAEAQSSLGVDTSNGGLSYVNPTSFHNNDPYQVTIKNYGPQALTGDIHVLYYLDSSGTNNMLGLKFITDDSVLNYTMPAGGTYTSSVTINITDSALIPGNYQFRQGINTVVIWPRSNTAAFVTHDSLKLQVLIMGYAGINNPILKISPKIFPNPARQELFVSNPDPDLVIEQVRFFTAEGKFVSQQPFSGKLELSSLASGVYFIEFAGKNGKTSRYKLIKE